MRTSSSYLDFNATAPARPEVIEKVAAVMAEGGNPSSVHDLGRRARARVEEARGQVAALMGAKPSEVILTGGGTESNALGLKGLIDPLGIERLIITSCEHPSVRDLAPKVGIEVVVLPVDHQGLVEKPALEALLESDRKSLVSIMTANNETGVLQPIGELASLAKSFGAYFHCDAIQAAGKVPLDFDGTEVDLMSISAHKFAGPQGVGALALKSGLDLAPQTHGGGQELGRRSGTENVAGIAGMGLAAELALHDFEHMTRLDGWRHEMERAMKIAAPEALILGDGAARLPNTTLMALPGVPAETQVIQMDLAGFAVSSGSACSSGKVSRSHVLDAMGCEASVAGSALRISTGWSTTKDEIDGFLEAWIRMRNKLSKTKNVEEVERRAAG